MAAIKPLDVKLYETCQNCWARAYKRWQILMEDEGFWSHLAARIRELDDPRLTTGLSRRIRISLPKALLLINARLAVQAAQHHKESEVRRHLQLIGNSGFDATVQNEALRESLAHVREQVKTMCSFAKEKSNSDPVHADEQAWGLLKGAEPLLSVMDMILPENDVMRDGAHDEVADQVIRCACIHCNQTNGWNTSLKIHEAVLPIAASGSTVTQIKENLEIIKQNRRYSTCFFCDEEPAQEGAVIEVPMYGNVQRVWPNVTWQHAKVKVPRCFNCRSVHNMRVAKLLLFGIIGVVLGIVLGSLCGTLLRLIDEDLEGFFGFIVFGCIAAGAIIGGRYGNSHGANVKSLSQKTGFFLIEEYKAKGWVFGEKPPNVR